MLYMFVSVNLMFYVFLTFLHYIENKGGKKIDMPNRGRWRQITG